MSLFSFTQVKCQKEKEEHSFYCQCLWGYIYPCVTCHQVVHHCWLWKWAKLWLIISFVWPIANNHRYVLETEKEQSGFFKEFTCINTCLHLILEDNEEKANALTWLMGEENTVIYLVTPRFTSFRTLHL